MPFSQRRSRATTGLAVAAVAAALLTVAGGRVDADVRVFADAGDDTGDHAVRSVRVDNSGPVVKVLVRHVGDAWRGQVVVGLDVTGSKTADVEAQVAHRPRSTSSQQPRYSRANGTGWTCGLRTMSSPRRSALTTLTVARSCLSGAKRLRAYVRVTSRGKPADEATTRAVAQQSRPNILMIMVDDMRTDDLAYMPNVRSLIGDQGVTFTNSFSQYPLCCPARASTLTGLYTHNHKVYSHKPPYGFPVFDDTSTIATWLHNDGYQTYYLGKYLNGYGRRPAPGAPAGTTSTQYVPPGWDDWHASIDGGLAPDDPNNGGTYRFMDTTLNNDGHGYNAFPREYQTTVYGRLASRKIADLAASSKPFFSYVSFSAPHVGHPREADDPAPVRRTDGKLSKMPTTARPSWVRGMFDDVITQAPGASWDDPDITDKPQQIQDIPPLSDAERAGLLEVTRQRAEALAVVDVNVRRILAALDATGELDRTLIVFMSDNGYFLGEQRIRQGKILPYEPSLRIPILMRGPGIPHGEQRADVISTIDIAPTLAAEADVTPPGQVDGQSMLGVAQTGDEGWTRPLLTETGPASIVRTTDESGTPVDSPDPGATDVRYLLGIRTERYLYLDRATGERELYDLLLDPEEYDNVVNDPRYATVARLMTDELATVRSCDGAECRQRMPDELVTSPGP